MKAALCTWGPQESWWCGLSLSVKTGGNQVWTPLSSTFMFCSGAQQSGGGPPTGGNAIWCLTPPIQTLIPSGNICAEVDINYLLMFQRNKNVKNKAHPSTAASPARVGCGQSLTWDILTLSHCRFNLSLHDLVKLAFFSYQLSFSMPNLK